MCFILSAEAMLDERTAIDHKLSELKYELKHARLEQMHIEITSQLDMLDEWERFAQQLELAEKKEHEVERLKKLIQDLELRKKELSKEK
jgi:transcription initiation factor TFIIIB Brf1 subunit/transcription initiation factor TFIIB